MQWYNWYIYNVIESCVCHVVVPEEKKVVRNVICLFLKVSVLQEPRSL